MSFSVGFFDLFSCVIPGFLYVFLLNEILALAKISNIDLFQLKDITTLILVVGLAYIAGMLFSRFAKLWYDLWVRKAQDVEALRYLLRHHPDLPIGYKSGDWALIYASVKQDHLELSNQMDREKAISIMLYNLSFGFFLLILLEVFYAIHFQNGLYLLVCAVALVASLSAMNGSRLYNLWFYRDIFEQGLLVGCSLDELLAKTRSRFASEPGPKTKRKPA